MPYIKNDERRILLQRGEVAQTAGELNYQIFVYVKNVSYFNMSPIYKYVKDFIGVKPNYQKYNDVTGCLYRCSKEIERRNPNPCCITNQVFACHLLKLLDTFDEEINIYEDKKILENGDV